MEILLEPTSNKLLVGLDDGVAASFQRSRIHKPHAHTHAFKVNRSTSRSLILNFPTIKEPQTQVDQGSQIKMIQVKEMMQDNDLKNSKSKDKGSRSRSQSMNEQSHYKQDKTKTRQSINVKSHIFNVRGDNDKSKQTPTRMSSVAQSPRYAKPDPSRKPIRLLVGIGMPPKRMSTSKAPAMTQAAIRKLVADSVATTLEAQAANMANTDNTTRPREAPVARQSELVFSHSNCTEDCKVKFATEEAYKITWVELKKLLIKKYCPRTEVQKMEDGFYHLTVKGNDLKTYVRIFQEIATLCPTMVPDSEKMIEVFIGGLPRSYKDLFSSKLNFDGMLRHLDAKKKFVMKPFEAQPTPSPPHLSKATVEPQSDPSPRPSPSTYILDSIPESSDGNQGGHSSSDKSLSGNEGDMTLQSVYDLCISLCTQGRKPAKGEPSVHKDPLFAEILEDTLDNMETDDAQDVGRTRDVVDEEKENVDAELSTEDVLSTAQQKVSTNKEKVSTDRPKVSTDGSKLWKHKLLTWQILIIPPDQEKLLIEEAYKITWVELKKLFIKKYHPRTEVQKMEDGFYHLTVKGNDLNTYVRIFQELATLCPTMVLDSEKMMEVFIGGLPRSYKDLFSSKLNFDGMLRHLDAKKKFVMYLHFISIFLGKQLVNVQVPLDHFPINALTSKVFSFMVKKGKHFSRKITPLFASMLVQPTKDEGTISERPSEAQPTPSPPHPSEATVEPQSDPSPRPSPSNYIPDSIPESFDRNQGGHSSSDKSILGNEGDMTLQSIYDLCISLCIQVSDQAKEIQHLKAQLKNLKKQAKPIITHHRAWMKSVSLKQRLGRKSAKGEPSVHKDPLFDEIPEDTLDNMETDDAQDVGRTRDVVNEEKENADAEVSTEDVLSTAQQKVSTDKEKVSTDRPKVSTDGSKVSTDKEKDSTDRTDEGTDDQTEERRATQTIQTTQTTTSTMFGDDETIAQVLLNMSQAKAVSREKEKGVEFKDVEETERPRPTSTRSLLTLKPLPKIDPKDKGKKKIEEEDESETESEGIPEAEKKFKQLASDEEMARKLQEDWETEEERARLAEEEATNDALIRNYDDIKARIEADRLLAERLQEEEREQFIVEERAKFLHDIIAAQRRFLAQQRSEAIRNKPPTKNQLRNQMMTYLKHVGNFQHSTTWIHLLKLTKVKNVRIQKNAGR
ncbi:reverse transcriptase domain-containing protein [Tanacetum coccineum]